jgi:hypothetical protein
MRAETSLGAAVTVNAPESRWGAPASRELAALFHEAFVNATGQAARWAAETVQGNRHFDRAWCVPFTGDDGLRGHFSLRWDAEFQRYLSARCGAMAQRPEFLGAVLRAAAGRWAVQQGARHDVKIRLLPSAEALAEHAPSNSVGSSTAALFVDAFVLELGFSLEEQQDPAR